MQNAPSGNCGNTPHCTALQLDLQHQRRIPVRDQQAHTRQLTHTLSSRFFRNLKVAYTK
jgi:hypothetical protein